MKSVFILASSWAVLTAQGITVEPADSLKISKDVSLDEVVVTATKVAKGTPVAYSELTQDELKRRNDGQGIPYLILQSPSVILQRSDGHPDLLAERVSVTPVSAFAEQMPTVSISQSTEYP